MKRLFLLLSLLFCGFAYADTINLHWRNYDGTSYQESTCVVDSDLILPATPPTRYGYTFTGWKLVNYIPIEYLESTGTQYIDTRFYPSANGYKAIGKIRFIGSQNKWSSVLGGNHSGTGDDPKANKFGRYSNSNNWTATFGADMKSTASFTIGNDYSFEVSFIIGNKYLKIEDTPIITSTSISNIYTDKTILIFTYNRQQILSTESMKGRIYYVKIYDENNTLVRDFIPVLDKDGVPCMFDKVTQRFFYNQGTGNFIAGPSL